MCEVVGQLLTIDRDQFQAHPKIVGQLVSQFNVVSHQLAPFVEKCERQRIREIAHTKLSARADGIQDITLSRGLVIRPRAVDDDVPGLMQQVHLPKDLILRVRLRERVRKHGA